MQRLCNISLISPNQNRALKSKFVQQKSIFQAIRRKGFCLFCSLVFQIELIGWSSFLSMGFRLSVVLNFHRICFTVCIWSLQRFSYCTKRPPRRSNGEISKRSLLLMVPMRSWPQDRKICLPSLFRESLLILLLLGASTQVPYGQSLCHLFSSVSARQAISYPATFWLTVHGVHPPLVNCSPNARWVSTSV